MLYFQNMHFMPFLVGPKTIDTPLYMQFVCNLPHCLDLYSPTSLVLYKLMCSANIHTVLTYLSSPKTREQHIHSCCRFAFSEYLTTTSYWLPYLVFLAPSAFSPPKITKGIKIGKVFLFAVVNWPLNYLSADPVFNGRKSCQYNFIPGQEYVQLY